MRSCTLVSLRRLIPVCWFLLPADHVAAQLSSDGSLEIGQRFLAGDRASSRFEEYREIPSGLFLTGLGLNLEQPGRYLRLRATSPAEADQAALLTTGIYGRAELELRWDRTRHILSNNGATVFAQPAAGVFALPAQTRRDLNLLSTTDTDTVRAGIQPDLGALADLVTGTARGVDLRTLRETGEASLRYLPAKEWDIRVQYSRESRSGTKPLGTNFAFNVNELPEPLDYQTQEFRVSGEYTKGRWGARLDYAASVFDNDIGALTWDNPFTTGDADRTAGRGQLDLYPDNSAHNLALSGAVNLPKATRLTSTVSLGWRRQDDPFLPFTVNSAVAALPNYPALPAASLKGAVNTTLVSAAATSRPLRDVSITARYRFNEYANDTPSLVFERYVSYDTQLSGDARRSLPIAHTRQNAGVEAAWRPARDVSLKAGYGWESWERSLRDAPEVDEGTLRVGVDLTPLGWLSLRTSYARSARTAHEYDAEEHVAHETFPNGETGLGQLPQLRKYDMASRDRDRIEVVAQAFPAGNLSLSGSIGYAHDDFHESAYGLLDDHNHSVSFDASYNPSTRVGLFAGFTRENYDYSQRSRQRTPASATAAANDKPDNDWDSDLEDAVNTFSIGLNGTPIPGKLDAVVDYSYSAAEGRTQTRTPGTPDLVTTAQDYPDTDSKLHQLGAVLQYRLSARVTPLLGYRYERYSEDYFYKRGLAPSLSAVDPATASSTFLGATQPDYDAHILSFAIRYAL